MTKPRPFLSKPCPTCRAEAHVSCVSKAGKTLAFPHAERRRLTTKKRVPPQLQDDAMASDYAFSTRASHAMRGMTVGAVRAMSDVALRKRINVGSVTLGEIRRIIGYASDNGPEVGKRQVRYTVVQVDETGDIWTVHVWATGGAHVMEASLVGVPAPLRVVAVFPGHMSNLLPSAEDPTP